MRERGGPNTMLTSSIYVMLKRLSVAHYYSLTAPVGIATGCMCLFFFPARHLWIESVHSQHTVSSKQEQLNIQFCMDPLKSVSTSFLLCTCVFIACILSRFNLTAASRTCFPHWQSLLDQPSPAQVFETVSLTYWDTGGMVEEGGGGPR